MDIHYYDEHQEEFEAVKLALKGKMERIWGAMLKESGDIGAGQQFDDQYYLTVTTQTGQHYRVNDLRLPGRLLEAAQKTLFRALDSSTGGHFLSPAGNIRCPPLLTAAFHAVAIPDC